MKGKFGLVAVVSVAILSFILVCVLFFTQKKTAFIDYNTVYNNCEIKKKLEKDLLTVTNSRKSELDSLQMELSFLSEKIKANTASNEQLGNFEDMKNRFLTLQEKYEEENIRLKETYFTQIRQEINEKAKEFSIKNGYDYLFSAMGDGSLMYASESEDVTEEFQHFIDK